VVLIVGRMLGSGAESGVPVEIPIATLTRYRDGVAVRTEEFLDPGEARREFEARAPAG